MEFAHWMIWLALFLLFAIIELSTVQLVSIWFAVGAVAGGVAALITGDRLLWVEIVAFAAVTALSLAVTKPLVKKLKTVPDTPTNKDKLPGKTVTVLSEVSKDAGTVRLNDIDFEARLSPEESVPIPVGEKAVVQEIDGIKLIVKAL